MAETIEVFVGLLLAVAGLGLLARKLNVPYPILFVIGGLLLGFLPGLPHVRLDPEFILLFFLPPLLFPAALFTSWRDFRANIRPISLLAVGLVIFTTVAVGVIGHHVMGMSFAAACVLGAIISPPDAIAATAIAERLSVPRRIVAILEGESLVNDATALVAYRFAVAAVMTGSFSVAGACGQFVVVALGGIAVGIAIGWLAAAFHRHVDDPPIEVTISLLTPFIAYLGAERLHVSGVLAVVTAGLYLGWQNPEITTSRMRLQGNPFWKMVEFILNGLVFILIGLELPNAVRALSHQPAGFLIWNALMISAAVIVIRIAWVFAGTYLPAFLVNRFGSPSPYPNWRHVAVVSWTGMRGVVSMAAALALPFTLPGGVPFPGRALIVFLTFSVILATLVVQGISLPFLIRSLGIKDDLSREREERAARIKANQAALDRLTAIAEREPAKAEALQRLRIEYEDRIRQLESVQPETADAHSHLFSTEYEALSFEALNTERETILELRNESVISDEVLRRIQQDIDLAEARLRFEE